MFSQTEDVSVQGAEKGIWAYNEGITGEWRILHNRELRDLYSLPNNISVTKSRMR
jgi:hypothetical protein